ncbi:MAG: YHS domain-containing (seleno)protein [Opitutales bacterium]
MKLSVSLAVVLRPQSVCLALASVLFLALPAHAFKPVATSGKERLALGGHDVVAYHTANKAQPGHVLYRYEWQGAVWQFNSRENLLAFRAKPEKYAPVYGGYCAVMVGKEMTHVCSGEHFLVHEGKLYIAGNAEILKQLRGGPEAYIKKADPTWETWVKNYEEEQKKAGNPSAEGATEVPAVPSAEETT